MSDSVREKFEKWAVEQGYSVYRWLGTKPRFAHQYYESDETQIAWEGYQAATAAADAEWRGVVEKLLQGNQLAQMELRELKRMGAMVNPMLDICLKDGEAQAEKLMGRNNASNR